ncbi:MAG: NADPH:quinone reductase [Pseudomonadota bacterium]
MRACVYSRFGPASDVLELRDLPDTALANGDVKVRLAFSGVNPSDVKARAGARPGVTELPFPLICPHSDGAGTIVEVGPEVSANRIGERVWIWNGQWQRPFGTAADTIVLPAEQAVALPEGVTFETGASLGIPGLTAAQVIFGGGDVSGKTLLIHGGNGSVGHLAVQLAADAGARVLCTASPSGFDRCKDAGADQVFDYRSKDLAQEILAVTDGDLLDRIIDPEFGENIAVNSELVAPNGTIAAYGSAKEMTPTVPFGSLLFRAVKVDITLIYILATEARRQAIQRLHNALSRGGLTCPVARVFPLQDTGKAHVAVEAGGRTGAILVDTQS